VGLGDKQLDTTWIQQDGWNEEHGFTCALSSSTTYHVKYTRCSTRVRELTSVVYKRRALVTSSLTLPEYSKTSEMKNRCSIVHEVQAQLIMWHIPDAVLGFESLHLLSTREGLQQSLDIKSCCWDHCHARDDELGGNEGILFHKPNPWRPNKKIDQICERRRILKLYFVLTSKLLLEMQVLMKIKFLVASHVTIRNYKDGSVHMTTSTF
jgi:hypothetical protein